MGFIFGSIYGGNAGMGIITADNGLTASGTNVELGGPLTKNTTIDNSGFDFQISGNGTFLDLNDDIPQVNIECTDVAGNDTQIFMQGLLMQLIAQNALSEQVLIEIATGGITVTDAINLIGMIYGADYTANQLGNDRAITDVGGIKKLIKTSSKTIGEGSFQGQTATFQVLPSVACSTDNGYLISFAAIVTAFTSGSVVLSLNYVDRGGTARAVTLGTSSAAGASAFSPIVIYPLAPSVVTMTATFTGTLTADITGSVLSLN